MGKEAIRTVGKVSLEMPADTQAGLHVSREHLGLQQMRSANTSDRTDGTLTVRYIRLS